VLDDVTCNYNVELPIDRPFVRSSDVSMNYVVEDPKITQLLNYRALRSTPTTFEHRVSFRKLCFADLTRSSPPRSVNPTHPGEEQSAPI